MQGLEVRMLRIGGTERRMEEKDKDWKLTKKGGYAGSYR